MQSHCRKKCSNPKGLVFEHLIDDMRKAIFIVMWSNDLRMGFNHRIPIDHGDPKATALDHFQIIEIIPKGNDLFDN